MSFAIAPSHGTSTLKVSNNPDMNHALPPGEFNIGGCGWQQISIWLQKGTFPAEMRNLGHKSALRKERHFNRLSWRSGETEKSKHLRVITLSAVLKLTRCLPSTSDRCQIAVVRWLSYSHYWASLASSCPAACLSLLPTPGLRTGAAWFIHLPTSSIWTAGASTGCKGQSEEVPAFRKQFLLQSLFFKERNTNLTYLTKGTGLEEGRTIQGIGRGCCHWASGETKGPKLPTFPPIGQRREQRYAEVARSQVRMAGRGLQVGLATGLALPGEGGKVGSNSAQGDGPSYILKR